jgi:hypothetical protein
LWLPNFSTLFKLPLFLFNPPINDPLIFTSSFPPSHSSILNTDPSNEHTRSPSVLSSSVPNKTSSKERERLEQEETDMIVPNDEEEEEEEEEHFVMKRFWR